MALDILSEKGVPVDEQRFTWRELAGFPYSKLDDDAFTRVRVILMNGVEAESVRFSHACARMNRDLQIPLARVRRVEHHQQTLVNWLNPADQSPLETTIGFEQTAIEVTAALAQQEPDPYLAQAYRFGMLEDFDHLYRFSALMDRMTGQDSNNILQSYTDVRPGRPTIVEHRAPIDDVRTGYDRRVALPLTKLNALVLVAAEHQVHDYYMNIGPVFSDPIARMLYESLIDPDETWLEKWLLHEATEVYTYWSCSQQEPNRRLRALWERMVSYELGQMHYVMDLMRTMEKRDPIALLPTELPDPIPFASQRDFVREVLANETQMRAVGTQFDAKGAESAETLEYREYMNSAGSPSEVVTTAYTYTPGTELAVDGEAIH